MPQLPSGCTHSKGKQDTSDLCNCGEENLLSRKPESPVKNGTIELGAYRSKKNKRKKQIKHITEHEANF